jgi:hypothetical protein
MSLPMAPFTVDALRPFVSVALHKIDPQESGQRTGGDLAEGLAAQFDNLFSDFDIRGENRFKISTANTDRGVIAPSNQEGISLTGVWFKRISAPAWLDARLGNPVVQDISNHIILVAIKLPYLAVLGTHSATADRLSKCLQQGYFCGTQWLGFITKRVSESELEQAFIRGRTRYFALSGLHASVETKPDSKNLSGRDLRKAIDPFADQTFTFTSVVSILPPLDAKRMPRHIFRDNRQEEHAHYAFRVGVNPEERRVWTVQTENSGHLVEELCVLFDTLAIRTKGGITGEWGYNQEGFRYLGKAKMIGELSRARNPFDIGLDLPPPVEPGQGIVVSSELQRCQELWRAYGQLEVVHPVGEPEEEDGQVLDGAPVSFLARLRYAGEPIAEYEVSPQSLPGEKIAIHIGNMRPLGKHDEFHPGVTCFETLCRDDGAAITIRYDSGHVVRESRIFRLGWEDVVYEAWKWPFRSNRDGCEYRADREKPQKETNPANTDEPTNPPERGKEQGWEASLGENIQSPASLFEYVVAYAEELFKPGAGNDWHLCCDDGAGEVADFVYFEPDADRLYFIHVKAAKSREMSRKISVKAYEEVSSQAVKNLRYLEVPNLLKFLEDGKHLPIANACFYNTTAKPYGSRDKLLAALRGYKRRLLDRKVIVFQPHVRRLDWKAARKSWEDGVEATPRNQINRFLQLRTLLTDAEITCRKLGAHFESWGEDDTGLSPKTEEVA